MPGQNAILDRRSGKIIVQTPLAPLNCLAFEGGGSRCAAFVGLHRVLHQCGILEPVEYVSGTSGGALYALAVALGYTPDEAEALLLELKMEQFLEGYHSWLSQSGLWAKGKAAFSIWYNNGHSLSSGKEFLNWLEKIVERKLGNKKATLADLAKRVAEGHARNDHTFKYLYVTGTNLSYEMPECKFLSHETEPDMPLALAVALSGAYPFVMEPVRWNNHLYGDGGLMWNLPTKVFDDRRFLPAGYDFNEKGLNPGVLAIKIDSQAEIDQVLWGKRKEVYLQSAGAVATAVYNALAQNTDTAEVREARLAIALPDNDIGVLDFSVSRAAKLGLIAAAERETQNFVENYFSSAYEVKTYTNVMSWLDSLTINDIDDVIAAYEVMMTQMSGKEKLKAGQTPQPAGDVRVAGAPALPVTEAHEPTVKELEVYIEFLEAYLRYRRIKKRQPDAEFKPQSIPVHINLKPESVAGTDWNARVEMGIKRKLKHVIDQLEYTQTRMESIQMDFTDIPEITIYTQLHDKMYFDNLQALTYFHEYQKLLSEEKKELEIKLGVFDKSQVNYSSEQSRQYSVFMTLLNPLLTVSNLTPEIKAVLPEHVPILRMSPYHSSSPVTFTVNLHDELDRKIYIIASLMYLGHKKCKNREAFIRLFQEFVAKDTLLPTNMAALSAVLKLKGYELLSTAYRIEELLHHFERHENPKEMPILNLDTIFGVDKLGKQQKEKSSPTASRSVSMKHMIKTSSIFSPSPEQMVRPPRERASSNAGMTMVGAGPSLPVVIGDSDDEGDDFLLRGDAQPDLSKSARLVLS